MMILWFQQIFSLNLVRWFSYFGAKYFIAVNKLQMKLISRSHLAKLPRDSLPAGQPESKRKSLGYCCQMGDSQLNTTRFSKRSTDPNISLNSAPFHDTSNGYLSANSHHSKLEAKEWKVQLNSRILSVTEIIGGKRGQDTGRSRKNEQSGCRRQKLEVSLSKRNKFASNPGCHAALMPRLSELGRERPFLKGFSRGGKIVDSVERRLSELQEFELICP